MSAEKENNNSDLLSSSGYAITAEEAEKVVKQITSELRVIRESREKEKSSSKRVGLSEN
jgi:hypothetical protein